MEASANVETDLESVSLTDKVNDNIVKTIRLEDDVEESKTDVEESFEIINNGDISDTDNNDDGKNMTNNSVSSSKDIISLDSTFDTSEKNVEHSASNQEEIETSQTENKDSEHLLLSVDAEDENLLDEIHSGDFNATSSPVSKSSGHGNAAEQSLDDSFEMLENDTLEEEQDMEEEEEKDQIIQEYNDYDNKTIVLDSEDEECEDDADDDDEGEEGSDESLDDSDKDENDDYDDHKDDYISTLSSDVDDIEMISKDPDRKSKITRSKKSKLAYKKLVKKSIKM